LVEGVKIASGNFEEFTNPSGSSIPQTVPNLPYSLRPDPARYPLTIASIGKGLHL
jgi:hypothetical protein